MSFMRDRGFATKLFAVLTLMLATLAAAATWSVNLSLSSGRDYRAAMNQQQRAGAMASLVRNIDAAALAAEIYALTGKPRFQDDYGDAVDFQAGVLASGMLDSEAGTERAAEDSEIAGALDRYFVSGLDPLIALGDQVAAGEPIVSTAALKNAEELHNETKELLSGITAKNSNEAIIRVEKAARSQSRARTVQLIAPILIAVVAAASFGALAATTRRRLAHLRTASQRIGSGNLTEPVDVRGGDEIGDLAAATEAMRVSLLAAAERDQHRAASRDALVEIGAALSRAGDDLTAASEAVLDAFVHRLGAAVGVIYAVRGAGADRYLARVKTSL